jgi:ATPase subunit of ABC transporter with duplicated ATPase domains
LDVNGKVLLEDTQLLIAKGKKYGLVGENGIGKTTLLYSLARKEIEQMNKEP